MQADDDAMRTPRDPVTSVPIPRATPRGAYSPILQPDDGLHSSNMSFGDDDDDMWDKPHEDEHVVLETDPTGQYEKYDVAMTYGPYKRTYKAFDNEEGIEVGWNEVRPDDIKIGIQSRDEIIKALERLKTFDHPNIVKVRNFWLSEDSSYIIYITEVLTSGTLKKYILDAKVLKLKIVKKWCRHILTGMQYLHSQDPPICHGDIQCDNIFISGHSGQVKIGDPFHSIFLRGCSEIGTPAFMAPELYGDESDHRVDNYAFGMCVLEMVTLETPYQECSNKGQVFKKVAKGCLPNSLSLVKHFSGRKFVRECLRPAEFRASASGLLADPFLLASEEDSQNVAQALLGIVVLPKLTLPHYSPCPLDGHHRPAGTSPRSPGRIHAVADMGLIGKEEVSPGGSTPTLFSIETAATSEQAPRVLSLVGRLNINGMVKQLSLDFRLDEDTCCDVANELVEAFQEGCPHLNIAAVSREIERAVMCSDYAAVKSPRLQIMFREDVATVASIEEVTLYQEMDALLILQEQQMADLARLHAAQSAKMMSRIGALRLPDSMQEPSASSDTLRELVQQAVADNHANAMDGSQHSYSGSEGKGRSQEDEGPSISHFKEVPPSDLLPAPEERVSEASETSDIPMLASLAGLLDGPPPPPILRQMTT